MFLDMWNMSRVLQRYNVIFRGLILGFSMYKTSLITDNKQISLNGQITLFSKLSTPNMSMSLVLHFTRVSSLEMSKSLILLLPLLNIITPTIINPKFYFTEKNFYTSGVVLLQFVFESNANSKWQELDIEVNMNLFYLNQLRSSGFTLKRFEVRPWKEFWSLPVK